MKCYPAKHLASYQKWQEIVLGHLRDAADRNLKLIWLDEVNFTKRSLQSVDWSARHTNMCVSQDQVYFGYRSVIAAVSAERGVELTHVQNHAVNHVDFGRFLGMLSLVNEGKPFALFLDNLAVHKHDIIK